MAVWLNHVTLGVPRNGTTTQTCDPSNATGGGTVLSGAAFTPTAGRALVVFAYGGVTFTTPAGWTLPASGSAVNNGGLYCFYKLSAAAGDTFTTTNNGANYPVVFDVYEFASGTTFGAAAQATAVAFAGGAGPTLTKSATSATVFGVVGVDNNDALITAMSCTWSAGTKQSDAFVTFATTDGYEFSVTEVDAVTATTAAYTATVTRTGGTPPTAERLMVSFIPGTGAAAAGPVAPRLPFPPFAAPFIQPRLRPFQSTGDSTVTVTTVPATGTATLDLSAAGGAQATAAGAATLDVTATGSGFTSGGTAGTATIDTTATGTAAAASTGAGAVNLTAAGTGQATATGTAVLSLTAAGTGVGAADPNQAPPQIAGMFFDPAAASFQLAGDSTVVPINSASGTAALTLTAAGSATAPAAGAGTLNVSAAAVGAAATTGGGSLTLTASGSGAAATTGAASVTVTAAGSSTATVTGTAAVNLTAAGTGAAASSGTAALGITAAGSARAATTGTGALTLAGAGTAQAAAAGAGSITFTAAGSTVGTAPATGTATVTVTATGGAGATASGSGSVTFTAAAVGKATAAGSATVTFTTAGTARGVATGTGAITVTAAGSAVGSTAATGTATLTIAATGTGTGPAPILSHIRVTVTAGVLRQPTIAAGPGNRLTSGTGTPNQPSVTSGPARWPLTRKG